MTLWSKLISALVFVLCVSAPVFAQSDDNSFLLKRGDNEFGFWAGYIGVRFHHISNGDRAGSNRGLNQFVIYAGFSIFR